MTDVDALVVGAGVTGLATAMELAGRGVSTCVLETHPRPGMETSTHNSGVIHAGLYYPPESLKARLCLEGRDALYDFCARHAVPHRRSGKLVVADEIGREAELEAIARNARACGARAELISRRDIAARQPGLDAAVALWSPDTGLVDASALVATLAREAVAAGAALLAHTAIVSATADANGIAVDTGREIIRAAAVVNAAGLFADDVSRLLGGEPFRIWACRGDYAEITGHAAARFAMPIYPLPMASGHGLGVHVTPTLGGSLLLGPTARYQTSKTDYESDRMPLAAFLEAGQRLLPSLTLADLREGGSGIRAKLHAEHESFADFMIRGDVRQPRLVHAAGIDSPGLTSCLAIGRAAAALAVERI
jgi:L-2-hydroxyglutarate oxidase LhgO